MKKLIFILFSFILISDCLAVTAQSRKPNTNWYYDVQIGRVPGYSEITKFGKNFNATAGGSIWSYGGAYPFPSVSDSLFISSDNVLDTNIRVLISGLDSDSIEWIDSISTDATDGRVKIKCCITDQRTWYRVNRVHVHNVPRSFIGRLYIYHNATVTLGVPSPTSKILAVIDDGENQTQNLVYTVPINREGIFLGFSVSLGNQTGVSAKSLDGEIRFRSPNESFRTRRSFSLHSYAGPFIDYPPFGRALQPGTDIDFRITDVSAAGLRVSGAFQVLLIDTALIIRDSE